MSMMQKFNYQEGIYYAIRQIRFRMLEGKTLEEALTQLEADHLQEMKGIQQWFKGMSDAVETMNQGLEQDIQARKG